MQVEIESGLVQHKIIFGIDIPVGLQVVDGSAEHGHRQSDTAAQRDILNTAAKAAHVPVPEVVQVVVIAVVVSLTAPESELFLAGQEAAHAHIGLPYRHRRGESVALARGGDKGKTHVCLHIHFIPVARLVSEESLHISLCLVAETVFGFRIGSPEDIHGMTMTVQSEARPHVSAEKEIVHLCPGEGGKRQDKDSNEQQRKTTFNKHYPDFSDFSQI